MINFHEQFLAHFSKGILKPNRYVVDFFLPRGIAATVDPKLKVNQKSTESGIKAADSELNLRGGINIKCHTMTWPQRTLQTYELIQHSSPYRVPYSQMYDPVTFSFYADATADTRRYFDIWQRSAVNIRSNTMNFYDEFTSNVRLSALDDSGKETYAVMLYEAYPLSVGAMEASYSQSNNFQTTIATLTYRYWEEVSENVSVGGLENIR